MKGSNVTVCPFVVQESYLRNTYPHTYPHYIYTHIHVFLSVNTLLTVPAYTIKVCSNRFGYNCNREPDTVTESPNLIQESSPVQNSQEKQSLLSLPSLRDIVHKVCWVGSGIGLLNALACIALEKFGYRFITSSPEVISKLKSASKLLVLSVLPHTLMLALEGYSRFEIVEFLFNGNNFQRDIILL